ncbi:hypothetical protein STEG23_017474, partial [Scotinomys teguina]
MPLLFACLPVHSVGSVRGTENRWSQASELTGDEPRFRVCSDAITEISGDKDKHPYAGTAPEEPPTWDGKLQSLRNNLT